MKNEIMIITDTESELFSEAELRSINERSNRHRMEEQAARIAAEQRANQRQKREARRIATLSRCVWRLVWLTLGIGAVSAAAGDGLIANQIAVPVVGVGLVVFGWIAGKVRRLV